MTIGDNVSISVSAKAVGPVKNRKRAMIGASAVVIHGVPAHAVVTNVPALMNKEDLPQREAVAV